MKEIVLLRNAESLAFQKRSHAAFREPRDVLIENIVARPDCLEGRHGRQEKSILRQQASNVPERRLGVGKMLQNIEHQDNGILVLRLEAVIKPSAMNLLPPTGVRRERLLDVDALDFAEARQLLEEQTISATYIQDARPLGIQM